MSQRKQFPINSGKKLRDPNATMNSTMNVTRQLNSTVLSAGSQQDYMDVQCDIAYSQYLQAVFMKRHTEKMAKSHLDTMTDQLSIQSEVLFKEQKEKRTLEANIRRMEHQKQYQQCLVDLEKSIRSSVALLKEKNMEELSNDLVKLLKTRCDRIYLENVQPLEAQEDYEKFELAFSMCLGVIQQIHSRIGETNNYENLISLIKENETLRETVRQEGAADTDLAKDVEFKVVRCISDMFAARHNT